MEADPKSEVGPGSGPESHLYSGCRDDGFLGGADHQRDAGPVEVPADLHHEVPHLRVGWNRPHHVRVHGFVYKNKQKAVHTQRSGDFLLIVCTFRRKRILRKNGSRAPTEELQCWLGGGLIGSIPGSTQGVSAAASRNTTHNMVQMRSMQEVENVGSFFPGTGPLAKHCWRVRLGGKFILPKNTLRKTRVSLREVTVLSYKVGQNTKPWLKRKASRSKQTTCPCCKGLLAGRDSSWKLTMLKTVQRPRVIRISLLQNPA